MSGEVIKAEGICDVENTIFVAVGKNVKEGKSVLSWALKSFAGRRICVLHIHQPNHLFSPTDGKLSGAKLKQHVVKACQELERLRVHKLLNQYLLFISQAGIQGGKVWLEIDNVEKGIIHIIEQHKIQSLVMGAAAETHYSKQLSELKSSKAKFVCQHAPMHCQIWFTCSGCLIQTRSMDYSLLSGMESLSSPEDNGGTKLHNHVDDSYEDLDSYQDLNILEDASRSDNKIVKIEIKDDYSPLHSKNKHEAHLLHATSQPLLEEESFLRKASSDERSRLEHAMMDAENSKQRAFEESVKRWRAEEDAMEAIRMAEVSYKLSKEKEDQRKEKEEILAKQKEEIERLKIQHDLCLKELQKIQEKKLVLESQITESSYAGQELEEKIIQAVELLKSFRKQRDEMQIEREHFFILFDIIDGAMTDGHLFNNISLGGRGGTNPGQLKVQSGGILWKKQGGGKAVEVDKDDIVGLTWMKVPRSNQLGVRIKDGLYYKFTGFRDQDVVSLTTYFQNSCGISPEEKQLSVSGKNWGEVDLNGNMLAFLVGSKQAFEISLADVSQTQLQGKNDVMLEFHVDDTTGANEKDSLMEISFHIPNSNTQFVGDENRPPAQVFRDKIMSMADVGAGGEEAVVTFDGIAILTPRGRYNVELHLSFLRLQGQANDFKIQYSSVVRIFLLPKHNQPHTLVVITLDPPIRKGQTLYPHIVLQFETDNVVDLSLALSEDLLNTKYKDRLLMGYKGLIHDIFTQILRGLSGAKVTKPGKFRSSQDGYAVKSSLKAEDGLLYPLEKSFFFLPKPPTLILHEEIDYVEFERHAAGTANMHYFDLLIRLKTEQEHLFRNIQRNEYHNLFDFINSKGLKIMNLNEARATEGVPVLPDDDDDAVDPHLERIKNEAGGDDSDEEDEDFVLDKDDGGSPTDDSGGDESDASGSGDEEKPAKKKPKKEVTSKPSTSRKKADDDGSKKKKQKKKKDPNAPKRAISAFMFFSQSERENVKKSNPGISFTDVGKVLGERWNKLSAEEKEPYEAMAKADKKRYSDQISGYKNPQPTAVDSGNDSGSS